MLRIVLATLCAFVALPLSSVAEGFRVTVAPSSRYSVDKLAVGGLVYPNSEVYKKYRCHPSEDYVGYTWCERFEKKADRSGAHDVKTTIVHGPDNVVGYINQSINRASLGARSIQRELKRLSGEFHSQPMVQEFNGPNGIKAVVAIWGGLKLLPLDPKKAAIIAGGGKAHAGILVDLLGDPKHSALSNFQIYTVSGETGFVWIASFNPERPDHLRFFAMDPSLLQGAAIVRGPVPETPTTQGVGIEDIPMVQSGGVYVVPAYFNRAITLDAVIDSGASDVTVPADVVLTLVRAKTISEDDFIGSQTYTLADGSKVPSARFMIRSLKVGTRTLENVEAGIAPVEGLILLGQSFLGRFKSWSIDNQKHTLRLVY
ncbi:MAG: retropepsin-like aspartic protease [Methylocystis silviterrae]